MTQGSFRVIVDKVGEVITRSVEASRSRGDSGGSTASPARTASPSPDATPAEAQELLPPDQQLPQTTLSQLARFPPGANRLGGTRQIGAEGSGGSELSLLLPISACQKAR